MNVYLTGGFVPATRASRPAAVRALRQAFMRHPKEIR